MAHTPNAPVNGAEPLGLVVDHDATIRSYGRQHAIHATTQVCRAAGQLDPAVIDAAIDVCRSELAKAKAGVTDRDRESVERWQEALDGCTAVRQFRKVLEGIDERAATRRRLLS